MKTPEQERSESEHVAPRTLLLIHRGIGVGILVMTVVGLWLPQAESWQVPPELSRWILVFLAMSAGLHLLCVVLLKQVMAHIAGGAYLPYCILRWALVEGIAAYGLVTAAVGFGPRWTAGFFALAAWLWWTERSRESDHELFLQQFR